MKEMNTTPTNICDILRMQKESQEHPEVEVLGFSHLLHAEDTLYVTLRFHLPHFGYDKDVQIPLSDVHRGRLNKHIPDGFAMQGVDLNQQSKEIAEKVHKVMQKQTNTGACLLQQGYNYIESLDRWAYVLGNRIVGLENADGEYCPMNPLGVTLPKPPSGDAANVQHAVNWCKLYIRQGEAQAALFLTALSSFIYPILHALQMPMAEALNAYVVGPTGVGKTAFAQLLTSFSAEHRGLNLTSDMKSIYRTLSHYVDAPCLVDDMCKSSSDRSLEAKKAKLSELIQAKSSGGLIEASDGEQLQLQRTGLIITAELLLPNPSTLNRCVVIHHETPFDKKDLTFLQKNQHLYLHFILAFTKWICKNRHPLTRKLQFHLQLEEFNNSDSHSDTSQYLGYQRVMQSNKILRLTEYLFVWFLQNTVNTTDLAGIQNDLTRGVKKAIADTLKAIKQDRDSDVLYVLAQIFAQDPDGVVADDPDEYNSNSRFVRWGKHIYFRGESATIYLSGKLGRNLTTKSMSSHLSHAHLLESFGMELSGDLPKPLKKRLGFKNKDRERYYKISVPALCDLVLQIFPEPFERLSSPLEAIRTGGRKGMK